MPWLIYFDSLYGVLGHNLIVDLKNIYNRYNKNRSFVFSSTLFCSLYSAPSVNERPAWRIFRITNAFPMKKASLSKESFFLSKSICIYKCTLWGLSHLHVYFSFKKKLKYILLNSFINKFKLKYNSVLFFRSETD